MVDSAREAHRQRRLTGIPIPADADAIDEEALLAETRPVNRSATTRELTEEQIR